jgi:hypothetical protein
MKKCEREGREGHHSKGFVRRVCTLLCDLFFPCRYIGVLEPLTDLISRFTVPAIAAVGKSGVFVSEDNGYEKVEHIPGQQGGDPATNMYPSQASAFIASASLHAAAGADPVDLQLSVALDRSKGVSSLQPGTLDVMQHRRGLPYTTQGSTVVLDDTDRIFTQMCVGENTPCGGVGWDSRVVVVLAVVASGERRMTTQQARDEQ